ncbi:hypothetical protein TSTA_036130 [Talaromyces stipitatus ATCC 10500]|uniref:SnoaL-like domain-containing protein n=1 Tax=Talaromyces stipitatus (strain ATCC 10500 / CBS 375.48 / QM 6759 / NRRL 1006) TaxID=441959 RepID=B8M7G7_TALSN|nr:uncharacterized protein TSTA_036130 [Talaromyces stipitatus ATCC 10500]EED20387.1 hypothetical protein TSTA_036130 [Talaromyces stipitatus ATCC 10500]
MTTQDHHREAIAWLEDFHKHTDSMDPNLAIPKFYADDCVFTFAANPSVTGQSNIIEFFSTQFPYLENVLPDRIYQEAEIRYVVKGDPERKDIVVNGMAVIGKRPEDEKMTFFTVYLDPTELKERINAVAKGSI